MILLKEKILWKKLSKKSLKPQKPPLDVKVEGKNLRELVGKRVIRTKPTYYKQVIRGGFSFSERVEEMPDHSYCKLESYVTVLAVENDVVIIESRDYITGKPVIESMDIRYDDNYWKSVDEALDLIEKLKKEKEEKEKEENA